jgi:predicted ATPase/DNA-binding CsgD family transcriptional regulator
VTALRGLAPDRLPHPLTSFVGREAELRELALALEDTRLLTLTGPGGCGKTRLALRVAAAMLDGFPGGVWWVELGALTDERLVGAAVAEELDVRPLPNTPALRAACAYLAPRRALVVLDNCEHLLPGCVEAAATLLEAAPQVVVLATSRAPLGVAGETDWRVPPLAASDAVSLFVERARKVRPAFALTDGNAEPVARICTETDGLPLAIELAAARVGVLSAAQIADGLASRLALLTGGPRTASERQRTLRASIEWSHELLTDDERVLLRRLAVFTDGFTLDAAERVCAADGLLDVLGSLMDQSLVIAADEGSAMRYRLLETMREFSRERIAEAGDEEALRDRHRDVFLALAEEAGPQLETRRQREWLERLDTEAGNLAAAFEHALRTDPAQALRFCAALYRWWGARGRFAEAELACSSVLAAAADGEPALRARLLHGRAYLAVWAGDFTAADAHATEALALAEQVGDRSTSARARCQLGAALQFTDPRAGRAELARAADLAREAGDDWAVGTAGWLTVLAHLWQSDHEQAARANDEFAVVAERLGDPFQVARRWLNVAWMGCMDGRFAEARDAIERMRAAVAEVGEPVMEALGDHFVAFADVWQGEAERARRHQQRSLERARTLGAGSVVPWPVLDIACADLAAGRFAEARQRLEDLLPFVGPRFAFGTAWMLCLLADTQRLLGDDAADRTAQEAQVVGERLGNRLFATLARLTRARLAAAQGDWPAAQQHALAHLDACVEGGHMTYVPRCLDALAEVAAGLHRHTEAARLLGAADRARAEIAAVRVPAEHEHWAAIEDGLRKALGERGYLTAREGLSVAEALEWARRARGPRRRPPSGWESLTATEARVVELAAEGLTNRQIGERMFISRETVKTHLSHIFRKLGIGGRTELAAEAARRG